MRAVKQDSYRRNGSGGFGNPSVVEVLSGAQAGNPFRRASSDRRADYRGFTNPR